MTPAVVLTLLATYGPSVLPLIQQIVAWIEGDKKEVTSADIQILIDYGAKKSADYLKAEGIPA